MKDCRIFICDNYVNASCCGILKVMAALLEPLGLSAEYLNQKKFQTLLAPGLDKAVQYIQGLKEQDLKHKVTYKI